MLVIILKNAPVSLRGELSRWLIEPAAGVFLGNPSARIRERLWKRIEAKAGVGYAMQVWSDASGPQGYRWRTHGTSDRRMVDFDEIALIARTRRTRRQQSSQEKGRAC